MFDFSGKRILISGATRGLGRAFALEFARAGARIALNYRRDEASAALTLDEIAAFSPRSMLLKADFEDDAQVRAMVARARDEMGGLDVVIANAAATAFKPLLLAKPHNLQRTFNLTIGGFVAMVQEASRGLSDNGRVIAISGIDSMRYMAGHGILGAAKAALESMIRYLAFELGPRGITVNGVNVGVVDTDSSRAQAPPRFPRDRRRGLFPMLARRRIYHRPNNNGRWWPHARRSRGLVTRASGGPHGSARLVSQPAERVAACASIGRMPARRSEPTPR